MILPFTLVTNQGSEKDKRKEALEKEEKSKKVGLVAF